MTQKYLAKELGVSPSQINRYIQKGMPFPISVENAKQWSAANILKQGPARLLDVDDDDIDLLIQYEIPPGEEPVDALNRLRDEERRLFGQIQAIENLLREASNAKLDRQLSIKRRQWIEASKGATAVWRIIKSMNAGHELEEALDVATKFIKLTLDSAFYWLHILPSKIPGAAPSGNGIYPEFSDGKARAFVDAKVTEIFDKLANLTPNFFAKSGLEELTQRAVDIIEAAKAEAALKENTI
jgi:transcriptional regulator with XRE-family HTH domain